MYLTLLSCILVCVLSASSHLHCLDNLKGYELDSITDLCDQWKPFLWSLRFEEIFNREAEKATPSNAESSIQNKMIMQESEHFYLIFSETASMPSLVIDYLSGNWEV